MQRIIDVVVTCIEWANIQQQSDGLSYSLLVIAYAIDIIREVNYIEQQMRTNIWFCLDRSMLKPFSRYAKINI